MRQRRTSSLLEVAQAGPSDEEEDYYHNNNGSSNGYSKSPNKNGIDRKNSKHKRKRKHWSQKWLDYGRHYMDGFLKKELYVYWWNQIQQISTIVIFHLRQVTMLQWLVVLVSLIFLGLPLLLFLFSERKVIQEHAIHYDIHNCPDLPPKQYPREYPILDILHYWPTSNLTVPERMIHKGICIFDLSASHADDITIRQKITRYRQAEVPFVIRKDPQVLDVASQWSKEGYLSTRLANKMYQATIVTPPSSHTNTSNGTATTTITTKTNRLSNFDEWWSLSTASEQKSQQQQLQQHYYYDHYASLRCDGCLVDHIYDALKCNANYRTNDQLDQANFLYDELPFFRPSSSDNHLHKKNDHHPHHTHSHHGNHHDQHNTHHPSLVLYDFMPEDRVHSGIQCSFQSPGFLEETQMNDNGGYYIAMLGGSSRKMLAHPKHCSTLYLDTTTKKEVEQRGLELGQSHSLSSSYHSEIHLKNYDFVHDHHHNHQQQQQHLHHPNHHYNHPHHPDFATHFPDFYKTQMNEVVLEAGDVLYLPTHWFHHSITLTQMSYQCQTPTGRSRKYQSMIMECLKR